MQNRKMIYDNFQINHIIFFSKDEIYDLLEYLIKVRISIKYEQVKAISNLKITLHNGLFNGVSYIATVELFNNDNNNNNSSVNGNYNINNKIEIDKIPYKHVERAVREKNRIPFVVIEQKIGINKKSSSKHDDNKLIPGIGLVPRGFKIQQDNKNAACTVLQQ